MSSTVLDEIAYLQAHAPDTYVAARLADTLAWSRQCHNTFDREYDYGRKGLDVRAVLLQRRACRARNTQTAARPAPGSR